MPYEPPPLLLGNPRPSEGLMRALGIKGDLPQDLLAQYAAHFLVDDLSKEEFAWTKRSTLWDSGAIVAPVVGQLSRVAVFPQSASLGTRAVMCIIEEFTAVCPTAGGTGLQWGVTLSGAGTGASSVPAKFRDDRQFQRTNSVYGVSGGAAVGNPIATENPSLSILVQNVPQTFRGPWILTGNDNGTFIACFLVIGTTGNVDLRVSCKWRERDILPEELA